MTEYNHTTHTKSNKSCEYTKSNKSCESTDNECSESCESNKSYESTNNKNRWKNIDDEIVDMPQYLPSLNDVVKLYCSVYNSLDDGVSPPIIGLPPKVMCHPTTEIVLSALAKNTSKRTKQELVKLTNQLKVLKAEGLLSN